MINPQHIMHILGNLSSSLPADLFQIVIQTYTKLLSKGGGRISKRIGPFFFSLRTYLKNVQNYSKKCAEYFYQNSKEINKHFMYPIYSVSYKGLL